jgi:hypothetical protein
MKLNTRELASGKMVKGSSSLQRVDDSFYSYQTKVAQLGNSCLEINPNKYSVTTSKQMTWLKRYYQKMGYPIVNWTTGEVVK